MGMVFWMGRGTGCVEIKRVDRPVSRSVYSLKQPFNLTYNGGFGLMEKGVGAPEAALGLGLAGEPLGTTEPG